jgi:hypothetical protein
MPRYLAVDRKGRPIAILLAEAHDHADLYGLRKLPNFSRVEAIPDDSEGEAGASMQESFEALGMSEASAAVAARDRPSEDAGLRVIRAPYQEASSAFRRPGLPVATPRDVQECRWKSDGV